MTELTDWVSSLEDLQETDLKIHRLNEQIADVPKNKEKAKSQLASYEQEVAEAKAQLTEKEKQIKNMQMDLDKFTADMQKVQTQSAMVKDNDAYRAMLNEIEHFKEQISDKEDEELEALEELDTCNSAMAKAKEHYDKQEALIQELYKDLDTRAKNCQQALDVEVKKRQDILPSIEEELLDLYERMLIKRPKVFVAINDNQCGHCHLKLTQQEVINAKKHVPMTQCGNCGTLIYR